MPTVQATVPVAEELADFRVRAREWLAAQSIPAMPADLAGRYRVQRDWQRRLHDHGWLALSWPQEYGGQGLTRVHDVVFSQERLRVHAPRPIGVIGLEIVGPTLLRYGTEEQKRARLPRLLSADDVWCQGFSEPEAGSDLASLTTRAERDGENFVLNGHKVWTTVITEANWCVVLARTDAAAAKHKGISFFLVDLNTPGVTKRPLPHLLGDAEFGEIYFENVLVPASNLIGELNDGWRSTLQVLSAERSSIILSRLTEIQVALADAVQALAAGPVEPASVADLGDVSASLFALECQAQRTMRRLVAGTTGPGEYDSADKLATSLTEQRVAHFIYEQLGGYNAIWDERPHGLNTSLWMQHYVMSRPQTLAGGTEQIQRNQIAERNLGMPKEPK